MLPHVSFICPEHYADPDCSLRDVAGGHISGLAALFLVYRSLSHRHHPIPNPSGHGPASSPFLPHLSNGQNLNLMRTGKTTLSRKGSFWVKVTLKEGEEHLEKLEMEAGKGGSGRERRWGR